jgi:hypothetical protein
MTGHFAKLLHASMSKPVQAVFTAPSDAIFQRAWYAGQQIPPTSCSRGSAAAAMDCIVIPEKVAHFKPPADTLGVQAGTCSVSPGEL